jgi:hypothetical protein
MKGQMMKVSIKPGEFNIRKPKPTEPTQPTEPAKPRPKTERDAASKLVHAIMREIQSGGFLSNRIRRLVAPRAATISGGRIAKAGTR